MMKLARARGRLEAGGMRKKNPGERRGGRQSKWLKGKLGVREMGKIQSWEVGGRF